MTRVAAVDCGSNSVRLLVAEAVYGAGGLRTIDRRMTVTRLGKGVDATGRLDDAALGRTLEVLTGYAARWRELGAARVRISATSAVRDAADRDRFFDSVAQRTGVKAVVLSGEDEARTAFRGATATLDEPAPHLVCDIGGGSTELIIGDGQPTATVSLQLGCVRLTERYLPDDPPTADQYADALAVIDEVLDDAEAAVDPGRAGTLVGVAGTVTTLAGLHLGLDAYDAEAIHGTRLTLPAVHQLTDDLAWITSTERARSKVIAPGREDVIVGGALILGRVMDRFGFADVLVSEADILDGMALDLAN